MDSAVLESNIDKIIVLLKNVYPKETADIFITVKGNDEPMMTMNGGVVYEYRAPTLTFTLTTLGQHNALDRINAIPSQYLKCYAQHGSFTETSQHQGLKTGKFYEERRSYIVGDINGFYKFLKDKYEEEFHQQVAEVLSVNQVE